MGLITANAAALEKKKKERKKDGVERGMGRDFFYLRKKKKKKNDLGFNGHAEISVAECSLSLSLCSSSYSEFIHSRPNTITFFFFFKFLGPVPEEAPCGEEHLDTLPFSFIVINKSQFYYHRKAREQTVYLFHLFIY